jgi:hypothetical protein
MVCVQIGCILCKTRRLCLTIATGELPIAVHEWQPIATTELQRRRVMRNSRNTAARAPSAYIASKPGVELRLLGAALHDLHA